MTDKIINNKRRKIILFAGGGALLFALGKIFDNVFGFLLKDEIISQNDFENFKIVDAKKELKVFTKKGEEILIIEKE